MKRTKDTNSLLFGSVEEVPGEITRGTLHLLSLPTGIEVNLSVILCTGKSPGPTVLITANIHGDEVNGVIIVHRFIESLNLSKLSGRVVLIPSLNPTGHLLGTRFPLFEQKDPNRCWPEFRPRVSTPKDDNDWLHDIQHREQNEPGIQERCFKKIAEAFTELKPDYHVDLHTFSTLSIPFVFMDRVIYNKYEMDQQKASQLWESTLKMVESFGLTVLLERPGWIYVKEKIHRTTSGYMLNALKVPSCTIELGPMSVALPSARNAGVKALTNLLFWCKMLDGTKIEITECPVLKFDEFHRYLVYPQTDTTGIVDFQKEPGEKFNKGDVLVIVRKIDGSVISKITSEMDGYVIAWYNGVAKYEGNKLGMIAVRDGDVAAVFEWEDLKDA